MQGIEHPDLTAFEKQAPGVRQQLPLDDLYQRTFTGTVLAEDGMDLSPSDRKGYSFEGTYHTEALGDVLQNQNLSVGC